MAFIVIEGIEGSGKSTLLKALQAHLVSSGHTVVTTREPGATAVGSNIRSMLLDKDNTALCPKAELMLFFADRAQHVHEVIQPALSAGSTVLCDRYSYSTLAYQGFGRKLSLETLEQCNHFVTDGILPNAVILLDLDPRIGLERARTRAQNAPSQEGQESSDDWNRFEEEELAFHESIRQGFLTLASRSEVPWCVLDATKDPALIAEEASHFINTQLDEHAQTTQKA